MSFRIIKKLESDGFSRNFMTTVTQSSKHSQVGDICPADHKKKVKRSWFQWFSKEEDVCQKKSEVLQNESGPTEGGNEPDLSGYGGKPYRTCGTAYIIQKEQTRTTEPRESEDKLVEKLEKHPDVKNREDTMPPFENVEKRMIDLNERKLHPLYKKYLDLPRKSPSLLNVSKFIYKSRSGPVREEEIPARLKINKELLEKKNIFSDFKKVEPPRQILAKMLEIQLNEKPTMETAIRRNTMGKNSTTSGYTRK